jgi:hypothetical protein
MTADNESRRGLEQMADYLLWNAEVEEARRRADTFVSRLPWLTTSQRDDVERVYVADRVTASRTMLQRNCDRAAELRGEYGERYQVLKRRCVAAVLLCVAAAVGLAAGLVLFLR